MLAYTGGGVYSFCRPLVGGEPSYVLQDEGHSGAKLLETEDVSRVFHDQSKKTVISSKIICSRLNSNG